ncbi:MAG: helix-turn-helix domain-containing protein [Candidatus Aminicenantaceae bacterium]
MKRRYITVQETAEYLSKHPVTIRRQIDRGEIPASKIGRSVRVDLKALDEMLERQRIGGPDGSI